jgi:hypothetical protein
MDRKQLASDDDTQSTDQLKIVIQDIIRRLLGDFEGKHADANEVGAALTSALKAAGIPEQPHAWVEATALEIAGGRDVVMDA